MRIDRSSPLPLWAQLKQSILQMIESGEWSPGARIPAEEDLVSTTGLSRATVRYSLDRLEREGRIVRVRGKGTFVAEPRVTLSVAYKLLGFWQDMTLKGHRVGSTVLELGLVAAPEDVAGALAIPAGSPVTLLKRLRTLDGLPFLVDVAYLRPDLCPNLESMDLTDVSLWNTLETRYGLRVVRAHRTLRIAAAAPWVSKLLGVAEGSPLHLLIDLAFLSNGEPIQFAHVLIPAQRSEFRFDLALEPEPDVQRMVVANSANPSLRSDG